MTGAMTSYSTPKMEGDMPCTAVSDQSRYWFFCPEARARLGDSCECSYQEHAQIGHLLPHVLAPCSPCIRIGSTEEPWNISASPTLQTSSQSSHLQPKVDPLHEIPQHNASLSPHVSADRALRDWDAQGLGHPYPLVRSLSSRDASIDNTVGAVSYEICGKKDGNPGACFIRR